MTCQICGRKTKFLVVVFNAELDWLCIRCYHWAVETLKRCVKRAEK